jgi:DNA replication and repair protein RecF
MHLSTVQITNFRNIEGLQLSLDSGVNLFWGDNAQGKTNILEAIYYLATGRSFRTRIDRECLPWNCAEDTVAIIKGTVHRSEGTHNVTVAISPTDKAVLLDGKHINRLGLLWGRMNAILFTPDDLQIVKGPPALRRRFLDMEISQISSSYLANLQRFYQILKRRNLLLKSEPTHEQITTMLETLDHQLAESAAEIFRLRQVVIQHLSSHAARYYSLLSEGHEQLMLSYQNFLEHPGELSPEETMLAYSRRLRETREDDLYRAQTTIGPHRDDLQVLINNNDARTYGSQGQQRSAAISIRLAEIHLMQNFTGQTPVLLLDDITSELDEVRTTHLLSSLISNLQTILTATDPEVVTVYFPSLNAFHVENGGVCK